MPLSATFQAHLESGATTLARAWALTRQDGVVMGFTDHDRDLTFAGITFRADTGMTARALSQTTGLSVDNSAAVSALSSEAITEEDISAGRYDGAALRIWMVNWRDAAQHALIFTGTLGEMTRTAGVFEAELRGLSEALNQPQGLVYQAPCGAVLGDAACRFDTAHPDFSTVVPVASVTGRRLFRIAGLSGFAPRWFEQGRLEVVSGPAAGLVGAIKGDREDSGGRVIELWSEIRGTVLAGDSLRLVAGCDRRAETCRDKFDNFLNFRGFPHIPGEDWLMSYPTRSGLNDGGSLKS
ncbi:hypothetical protein BV509_08095 [Rhodovulum sulfidophilum]|uniref:DUF2163 domain-containing protein n=1 Tax=Rhodovulum visakhapatnamense TaxID=364297 RepID=A0ABS1RAS8_9RHOB|nr:DUF2163 domain-containing protein [Rhodovulum visakhapatnamense]MBL3569385.1 DUF2163 domain-containing protein [Rhodovulum visakhapatnamense]MBL3576742.1 DUF2163 domain-containing protein [Rhodovulum visakhapatnamense]OLS44305.1 hypothetical protein BV509_08095 [Rhodovulum sulfidophilum]